MVAETGILDHQAVIWGSSMGNAIEGQMGPEGIKWCFLDSRLRGSDDCGRGAVTFLFRPKRNVRPTRVVSPNGHGRLVWFICVVAPEALLYFSIYNTTAVTLHTYYVADGFMLTALQTVFKLFIAFLGTFDCF